MSGRGWLENEWALPCGCIAALEPVVLRLSWVVVARCDEHPSGDVPVPSMALLSPASTQETAEQSPPSTSSNSDGSCSGVSG